MSDIKSFLEVCKRYGYPNPKLQTLADLSDYNLDGFLMDLKSKIGEKGVVDFCENTIKKLTGEKGLRVDLEGPKNDEYCYIHIYPIYYDEDESENDVISKSAWGESSILGTNEEGGTEYMTIQEVIDNTGMGEWSELDELLDHIKAKAYNKVFQNCGFGIWWE